MRTRSTLIALVVAGSLLGACHKQREPATENQQIETPQPAPPVAAPVAEKPEATAPKSAALETKAAPKPSADEQMMDDADATGMTSHTSPNADGTGADGNSQP